MRREAINSTAVRATAINDALSDLRCVYLGDSGPGFKLWLDARDRVGKLVRRLGADRDFRTPPLQRCSTVAIDAGTDASTFVERLAADLHGLDRDLSSKNEAELAYRAATACEALARVLKEAERAGWRSPHRA
jgi:hypothetical protein